MGQGRGADGLTLDPRALGRATLARQHLLARSELGVDQEIEHLVGMQSQIPTDPYVALWSRLAELDPEDLSPSMAERRAVRMTLMRGTIHLVTARDALRLRPILQPMLERLFHHGTPFGRNVAGMDMEILLAEGRRIVEEAPRNTSELGRLLRERWPDRDAQSLSYAVRYLLPLVQVTPRGMWGSSAQPRLTTLESWLGRPMEEDPSVDDLVLRYLGAYGPASVMDMQSWSGLTRLGEVFERLRPRLITFGSDLGRQLFDLPDAPRPDPETPAPLRFLPTYDNVLLAHADRRRFMPDKERERVFAGDLNLGSFLIDGSVAGAWRTEEKAATATITLRPAVRLDRAGRSGLLEEAERLVRFVRPGATQHEVEVLAAV